MTEQQSSTRLLCCFDKRPPTFVIDLPVFFETIKEANKTSLSVNVWSLHMKVLRFILLIFKITMIRRKYLRCGDVIGNCMKIIFTQRYTVCRENMKTILKQWKKCVFT